MSEAKRKELAIPPDSRLWVVTIDSHPMPYEINQYPYKVVVGSEEYTKAIVEKLNAKKGEALFEYFECGHPTIVFENGKSNHE